jgi:hypothetical protein
MFVGRDSQGWGWCLGHLFLAAVVESGIPMFRFGVISFLGLAGCGWRGGRCGSVQFN